MTTVTDVIDLVNLIPSTESYSELLRSGPHWLFELTLEVLSAPLAFALGWLWRNHVLRHLHRDLQAITGGGPGETGTSTGRPGPREPACPARHDRRAAMRIAGRVHVRDSGTGARAHHLRTLHRRRPTRGTTA